MSTQALLLLCAIHSLGFALFHLAFWTLFKWPRTLATTTLPSRAIVQIANVQLVWVFLLVAVLCLLHPQALVSTPLGRALLWGMSGFWTLRLATQFVWLRVNHPLVHALSLAFALGAIVFALAAFAG